MSSPSSIIRDYATAFEELNLDYPNNILDEYRKGHTNGTIFTGLSENWIIRSVHQWLRSRTEADCLWLVVLDNTDDLTWLPDIIPQGPQGSLIVTSRDRQVGSFVSHTLHIGDLDDDEALQLLLKRPGSPSVPGQIEKLTVQSISDKSPKSQQQAKAASAIVELLGNSPLAISMANAYLAQHDIYRENLTLYLNLLSQQSFSALERYDSLPYNDYRFTLPTLFETTYTRISEVAAYSAWLLNFVVYLYPHEIEDQIFEKASAKNVEANFYQSQYPRIQENYTEYQTLSFATTMRKSNAPVATMRVPHPDRCGPATGDLHLVWTFPR
ncbi:putative NB-ARC domain-containing protein [Seiridium cardinale]